MASFPGSLNPLSGDIHLARGAAPEAAVALAKLNGEWAAAYREGTVDGKENIVVAAGDS